MSICGDDRTLKREEIAWNLVELLDELSTDHINEVLVKNVPFETLRFIASYTDDLSDALQVDDALRRRLSNLVLLGYLMRVVEERLAVEESEG